MDPKCNFLNLISLPLRVMGQSMMFSTKEKKSSFWKYMIIGVRIYRNRWIYYNAKLFRWNGLYKGLIFSCFWRLADVRLNNPSVCEGDGLTPSPKLPLPVGGSGPVVAVQMQK